MKNMFPFIWICFFGASIISSASKINCTLTMKSWKSSEPQRSDAYFVITINDKMRGRTEDLGENSLDGEKDFGLLDFFTFVNEEKYFGLLGSIKLELIKKGKFEESVEPLRNFKDGQHKEVKVGNIEVAMGFACGNGAIVVRDDPLGDKSLNVRFDQGDIIVGQDVPGLNLNMHRFVTIVSKEKTSQQKVMLTFGLSGVYQDRCELNVPDDYFDAKEESLSKKWENENWKIRKWKNGKGEVKSFHESFFVKQMDFTKIVDEKTKKPKLPPAEKITRITVMANSNSKYPPKKMDEHQAKFLNYLFDNMNVRTRYSKRINTGTFRTSSNSKYCHWTKRFRSSHACQNSHSFVKELYYYNLDPSNNAFRDEKMAAEDAAGDGPPPEEGNGPPSYNSIYTNDGPPPEEGNGLPSYNSIYPNAGQGVQSSILKQQEVKNHRFFTKN